MLSFGIPGWVAISVGVFFPTNLVFLVVYQCQTHISIPAKVLTLLFIDMGPKGSEKSIIVQWNKVQGMWICFEFYVNYCKPDY